MIIGPRSAIILLDGIDGSLSDAVRGVVRISAGRPQGVGTGWLITPQLVIVPSYVVRDANRGSADVAALTVETFAGTRVAWRSDVEPVHVDAAEGSDLPNAITVVRLAQPDGPRPLRLGLDAPQVGRQVFVLQYPLGAPRLGMSTGHIVADEPPEPSYLSYTADTEPGAGGGPVLDEGWRVIGVHVRSVGPRRVNQAISRARLLDRLRASPVWAEIAAFQEIAEVRSVQVGFEALVDDTPAPILVRAATRASVERASLTDAEAEQLRPHVIDDAGARWSLRASDREDIIRRVGSLAALRASRDASQPDGAIDRAIVRILAGPPYDLTGEDDEVLGGWMQAARWFASVVPGLPSAALANVVLERRRLRGRLEGVGGAHFRGRAAELAELASWWDASPPVPFSLTGIGGVGKSALVAHYALSLPPSTVILWLDFDRPDLAPDQALSLLAALSEQARLQVEGLALTATTVWEDVANDLGAKLAAALGDRRTLLVLDSFEVAQYADRYQQLWPVVEKLMTALPGLRLIVTGRAPVANLTVLGQAARLRHLGGLEPAVARAMLADAGVTEPAALDSLVEMADGIPLILRLAIQLIKAGGDVAGLPAQLPATIVEGMLYERILDRMRDPSLKPVARGVLVLRRVSAEMIAPILGGLIDLPATPIATWFADLGKELAIVEGTDPLRVRPEVRAAALRLLERDDQVLVRAIDERAATWYAAQPPDAEIAAELVYHRLRLGDVGGAGTAWRDGAGAFLQYAVDELPAASQAWLLGRLGTTTVAETPLDVWEADAAERIREGNARGLSDHLAGILGERAGRSPHSPLLFFDAYHAWRRGDVAAARQLLDAAAPATGSVARDRMILAALLRAQAGDRAGADTALRPHRAEAGWYDHELPVVMSLAVRAARVVLAIDLPDELALARDTAELAPVRGRILAPIDVLLPALQLQLRDASSEVQRSRQIESPGWSEYLWATRRDALLDEAASVRDLRGLGFSAAMAAAAAVGDGTARATRLAALSELRWRVLLDDRFLVDAAHLVRNNPVVDPLSVSIAGVLALVGHALYIGSRSVAQVLLGRLESVRLLPVSRARLAAARALIPEQVDGLAPAPDGDEHVVTRQILALDDHVGVALHLLGPDPLETLVHRIAGQVDWPPRKE